MRPLDGLLAPADAVRSKVFRWVGPWAAPLFRDRARRVAWLGVLSIALSLALTMTVPLWSLALGPILLGVPHLLADVRYLVVRPGLHRQRWLMLACTLPLVIVSLGFGPAWGVLAMLPAALITTRGSLIRKGLLISLWAGLTVLALNFDIGFQLIFLHLHNLIAVGIWWLWRKRDARAWWVPLMVIIGVTLLLLGVADPLLTFSHGWTAPPFVTSFEEFIETTTPLDNRTMATRMVLVFCFLQAVHYVMWLRLIPEDDRPRAAPRRFTASADALISEMGWPVLSVISVLAVALAVWGAVNLAEARLGYLHVAAFHGYLELAVLARWFTQSARA